ncbi:MAG: DNA gyrase C-terminal beta-propeller domain-containing protein, partial [Candidatus Puniceispirillaceae bacterium]
IKDPEREFVLSITENGYGKRTSVEDYRRTGRGGQGVANIETSERNGLVVASFTVFAEDQLMLVTDAGKVIRIRVDGGEGDTIRVAGRKTQGVRLFEVDGAEKVVSVGVIRDADTDEEEEEGAELAPDTSSDATSAASSDAGDSAEETTSNDEGSA